jgi:TolA-binding protein
MRRLLIAAILMGSAAASPIFAQTNVINLRVDKLEKEMKAVQRKVFPGGVGLEPEIDPATVAKPIGTPSNAPIADLTERVNALENQLKTMTGQVEQNEFRLKKLEDSVKAFRAENDARLKALEGGASETPVDGPAASTSPERPTPVINEKPKPVTAAKSPATEAKLAPPKIDPSRKSAVAAVEIPATGDDAEDIYIYGFRLYNAKFYPEAQVKLKEYIAKYPSGKRASFARNLLGRAYLDEGKPALASVAFYDNYQKLPRGERAAESLTWLGASLTRLKKTADACKVYAEFDEVYGSKASADLKAKVTKGRADAKCTT